MKNKLFISSVALTAAAILTFVGGLIHTTELYLWNMNVPESSFAPSFAFVFLVAIYVPITLVLLTIALVLFIKSKPKENEFLDKSKNVEINKNNSYRKKYLRITSVVFSAFAICIFIGAIIHTTLFYVSIINSGRPSIPPGFAFVLLAIYIPTALILSAVAFIIFTKSKPEEPKLLEYKNDEHN